MRTTLAWLALAGLLGLLGTTGCGGGGGGGSSVPSVYRGTWYGGFEDGDGVLNVIEMTVSDKGTVSGKAREPGSAATGAPVTSLSGSVSAGGILSLKLKHPDGTTQTVAGVASLAGNGVLLSMEVVPDPAHPNEKITIPFDRQRATDLPGPLSGEIRIEVAPGNVLTMPVQSAQGVVGGRMVVVVQTSEGPVAVETRLGDDAAGANKRVIGWSPDGRVLFGTYTVGVDSIRAEVDLQWEENGTEHTAHATIDLQR
ncbi:MAG: hypothetical protein ACK41F_13680 [Fimbriimonadaceae bacterium]